MTRIKNKQTNLQNRKYLFPPFLHLAESYLTFVGVRKSKQKEMRKDYLVIVSISTGKLNVCFMLSFCPCVHPMVMMLSGGARKYASIHKDLQTASPKQPQESLNAGRFPSSSCNPRHHQYLH